MLLLLLLRKSRFHAALLSEKRLLCLLRLLLLQVGQLLLRELPEEEILQAYSHLARHSPILFRHVVHRLHETGSRQGADCYGHGNKSEKNSLYFHI